MTTKSLQTLASLFTWRKTMIVSAVAVGLTALSATDLPVIGASQAHAIIGRPFTPRSVAGVARRTVRRTCYYAGCYPY